MKITIEANKNEDGSVSKRVTIEGHDLRFYEIIGILELTKHELCHEESQRSEESPRRQA
jgi:hypothetical protein